MKSFLDRHGVPLIAYIAFWTLFFGRFWAQAFTVNADGGLTAGHVNIWGDWAIHLTMGSSMAFRELFLEQNPLLINSVFKYPFFVNQISAVLIRLGVPFFAAFTAPSFVFCIFFVISVYAFARAVLRARRIAIVASLVFLLNGGLGFVKFFKDVKNSPSPISTLFAPPEKYSRNEALSLYWINVVDSMVIPQRAFQLGFPWALCVMAAVYRRRKGRMPLAEDLPEPEASFNRWTVAGLGALIGFLPIVHAHSFAGAVAILGLWALHDIFSDQAGRRAALRWWATFAAGVSALAVPIVAFFFSGAQKMAEIRPFLGWYANEDGFGWFGWWWRNWGITPYVAILGVALCCIGRDRRQKIGALVFFAPFAIMFAAANMFLFHPWIWDNTKILVWTSLGVALFAAVTLNWAASAPGRWKVPGKIAAGLAFAAMTITGAIDLYRIQVFRFDHDQMYSNEDLYLADWARKNTSVESIWLTGDYHNNWLFNLTGRQAVMTYIGWLWTHAYNYFPVEADVRAMYQDPFRDDLFRKYNVNYVVVGPYEREHFGASPEYARRFPAVMTTDNYAVYQVSGAPPTEAARVTSGKLDAVLPLSSDLDPGLIKRTYRGKYFYGKSFVEEGNIDLNFRFNAEDPKPFTIPCSIEWKGYLKVPFEAAYRFSLASDDGSWLFIDDKLLIDNGGSHMVQEMSSTVTLGEGYHRIGVRYFEVGGGAILSFGWSTAPAMPPQIESDALYH